MKSIYSFVSILLITLFQIVNAQNSCSELLDYVEIKGHGITYYSYSSDAIWQVTFYDITDDNYNTYYFAVVRFTSSYTDYIYQVSSNTKFNYSIIIVVVQVKPFGNILNPIAMY